ncbi:type II toxin-antitoxin system antitoxin SocA domain-containing protein [Ancylomarina sp. 16SWW S1-10-2]|uniref:type II toxin-antitoxin system antitoxin SocA domain-containing protein n=1 Tax=Ancylomarina sp. 16SWW S1-10-2 TaxID=2499681 RepID=UPI0018A0071F|nr:type II toxin-antitoxin system antitoxin SocA domain-containing protein [Ancylomarina sp. 16SWW S1-10-2]
MKNISQKEIGKRVSELRKAKGYSQDELSKLIEISRSSLTQIELGNRNLSVLELKKIADNLHVSIDKFLSSDYKIEDIELNSSQIEIPQQLRVSIPELNIEKFKNVFLYILEKCAGKPNVGETLLYKLLYFADFNYYEIYEEHLSGAEYRKLPYGPVPQKLDAIIKQMILSKKLERFKSDYHTYPQTRYFPLVKPDLTNMKASEKEVIDRVIERYSDWSASAISEYSHKDIPWLASKDGEVIDYELAFYREYPYSVRTYDENSDGL